MIISILGQGAWGTALTAHIARTQAHEVRWWGRDPQRLAQIADTRCNDTALPDISVPDSVQLIADLESCVAGCDWSVWAAPVSAVAELAQALGGPPDGSVILSCKGMDPDAGAFPSEILERVWGTDFSGALLSGPTFADDLARGAPMAAVMAARDAQQAREAASVFHHGAFRLYESTDIAGVQLGGAVKNVLAIAAGIACGLKLGDSARAALITRGIRELMVLGEALGARAETLAGLSGLGDIALSCASAHSRNFHLGQLLGEGHMLEQAHQRIQHVTEGQHAARAICRLGEAQELELPICVQVDRVLEGSLGAAEAVAGLLARPARAEFVDG